MFCGPKAAMATKHQAWHKSHLNTLNILPHINTHNKNWYAPMPWKQWHPQAQNQPWKQGWRGHTPQQSTFTHIPSPTSTTITTTTQPTSLETITITYPSHT
jgi:hypothetical protein